MRFRILIITPLVSPATTPTRRPLSRYGSLANKARPGRLELPTDGFEARCSVQLSYRRDKGNQLFSGLLLEASKLNRNRVEIFWTFTLPPAGAGRPVPPLAVFLAGVVVPLEDGKGRVAGNGHDAFVVPSFPDLPGDKSMAKVVKVQVRQASIPPEPFSLDPWEPSK